MRALFFLFLSSFFFQAFSQSDIVPIPAQTIKSNSDFENSAFGYLVELSGDTVSGFLKKEGDMSMVSGCQFSRDGTDFAKHDSNTILAFGNLELSRHYRLEKVGDKELFLQVLVDGRATLLYSVYNSGTFYMKKQDEIRELVQEYIIRDGREYEQNKYLNILNYFMADEPSARSLIKKVQLTKQSLVNITHLYNSADNQKSSNYFVDQVAGKAKEKSKIHFFGYVAYTGVSEYNGTKFKSYMAPGIGVEFGTPSIAAGSFVVVDMNFGSSEVASTLITSAGPSFVGSKSTFNTFNLSYGRNLIYDSKIDFRMAGGLSILSNTIDSDQDADALGFSNYFVGFKIGMSVLFKDHYSLFTNFSNYSKKRDLMGPSGDKLKISLAQVGVAIAF